jgi:hypothetical protein
VQADLNRNACYVRVVKPTGNTIAGFWLTDSGLVAWDGDLAVNSLGYFTKSLASAKHVQYWRLMNRTVADRESVDWQMDSRMPAMEYALPGERRSRPVAGTAQS